MPLAARPKSFRRAARGPAALSLVLPTLLIAGVLLSPAALAYVRTPSPDGKYEPLWHDPAITMTLRSSGPQVVSPTDFLASATSAGATWSASALDTSVAFTITSSPDAPDGTHFDHINAISFRTTGWSAPLYPDGALALTTVWNQGAQIVDADTEINAQDPRFKWGVLPDDPALAAMASEVDLQNALTHELGHVLGLSHPCYLGDPPDPPEVDNLGGAVLSCSDPALPASVREATMFPSSMIGSISERSLSPDEVQALHDLYPVSGPAPGPAGSLGGREGGCRLAATPEGPHVFGLTLVGAALALARRRRRRSE